MKALKDAEMLLKSLRHSVSENDGRCWWDTSNETELERMAEHLSDSGTPEHKKIRQVLHEQEIRSVLDSGCGVAAALKGFLDEGTEVNYVGADISSYMLNIASSRYPHHQFVKADVRNLPFEDSSFDCVVLKHVLEHLEDYLEVVGEAVRVASKTVVIDFFHRLLPVRKDLLLYHEKGFWENWYSRSKFEDFVGRLPVSGFRNIKTIGTSRQTAEIYVLDKV